MRTGRAPLMVRPIKRPFSVADYLDSTVRGRTMALEWITNGVPRWVTLLDEVVFVVASLVFVAGSFDFYPGVEFEK